MAAIVIEYRPDDSEFRVRPAGAKKDDSDGKTYFTNNYQDAYGTAQHMAERIKGCRIIDRTPKRLRRVQP